MKIPDEIINELEKATEGLQYGKFGLTIVMRGSHVHYEIDKHISYFQEENGKIQDSTSTK